LSVVKKPPTVVIFPKKENKVKAKKDRKKAKAKEKIQKHVQQQEAVQEQVPSTSRAKNG
jgi:hypothetical protein